MVKGYLVLTALALVGCAKPAMETQRSDNPEVRVERLFSIDGCDVYRFGDDGRYHYFARCGDVTTAMHAYTVSTGKSSVTRYEEIPAIQVGK